MQQRFLFQYRRATVLMACLATVVLIAMNSRFLLADKPPLTGCKVTPFIEQAPEPSFVGQDTSARFSAGYERPTSTAECEVTGPDWTWSFRATTPVERKNPTTGEWEPDPYRPTIIHLDHSIPNGRLQARFPRPGPWRVTLVVTAVWGSTSCEPCTVSKELVINFPDVTSCSFAGIVIPDDNFWGRSTTRLGLGEDGKLEPRFANGTTLDNVRDLKWTVSSGNDFIDLQDSGAGDGKAKFTVFKASPGQVVLKLESNKAACASVTVTLDIVKPSGVYHTYERDAAVSGTANDRVAYGVMNTVHLEPKDVSFSYIAAGEGAAPGNLTGAFLEANGFVQQAHQQSGLYATTIGDFWLGSRWQNPDEASYKNIRIGGDPGKHVWEIPQQWFEAFDMPHAFCTLIQEGDFDGNRTIRVRKGGVDKSGPPAP